MWMTWMYTQKSMGLICHSYEKDEIEEGEVIEEEAAHYRSYENQPGWHAVPAHDPVVKDAADHAVKTIKQRSNSLVSYELLDILLANAEVIEDQAKFNLLLKLKRGSKEGHFKVEVHKTLEGSFILNQMQQQLNNNNGS